MATLAELLNGTKVIARTGNLDISINGVSDDSREIREGCVFVCMSAVHESQNAYWVFGSNGNDYIPDAIERGAVAVVSQNPVQSEVDGVTFVQVQDARYALAACPPAPSVQSKYIPPFPIDP